MAGGCVMIDARSWKLLKVSGPGCKILNCCPRDVCLK